MKAREQFRNAYGISLRSNSRVELLFLLVCLETDLAFSYIGFIQLPPISVTTLSILVVVAAMYFGPGDAVLVSLVFAVASMWKASLTSVEEGDIIFSPLLSGKPVGSLVMAVGARVLFALAAGFMYRWYFSKDRKHRALGISVIAVVSTGLHALFVYIPMDLFFGASAVETGRSFNETLLLNNFILYAATVLVVLGCDWIMRSETVGHFFRVISDKDIRISKEQKRISVILAASVIVVFILVCVHFMSRIVNYFTIYGESFDSSYISWTYALLLQLALGFAAAFAIIALFFRWMQEYFSAVTETAREDRYVREEMAQNNARMFALEDNFESLYDVNLDTGDYEDFIKGQTYSDKISRHFVKRGEFFETSCRNIDTVAYPEDREEFKRVMSRDYIRQKLDEESRFDYYYRLLVDGEPVWFRMRVVWKDEEKKNIIIGIFNASKDVEANQISEQKAQLEVDMQMIGGLADRYDTLYFVNIDEGFFKIYALDGEKYPGTSNIVSGQKDPFEALRMFGSSPIVYPDDRCLFEELTPEKVRERLAHSKKFSLRYRQADGGEFVWFEMEVVKYEETDERANALAIGFTNCDSEIRAEQEYQQKLEDARVAADAANEAKSNFLFNMSHDIRTPMNAIRGFTTMAKKNAGDPAKVSEYLDKIDISGQQLLTLINQVLEMARIESGKISLEENRVSIRDEFNSMVTVLSEQAEANGLKFSYALRDIEHNNVIADEARMGSITLNIAGNAMKYTPEGGSVDFVLREVPARKPGYATYVFTVTDTGIGMSEEYLKRLYEPFTREKNSTVSKIQGTGLGLSIVKSTIDLMGGIIEVHSKPGEGTRFDVTADFRIDESAGGTDSEEGEKLGVLSFEGRRVLLVEDNEMNREIAKDLLEEQGLTVEEAEDGDVALAMFRAIAERGEYDYYDFILMDVQMPRMSGYEATRAIRAIPAPDGVHVPIIAMTANAFEEDRQNALAAGMDEHLAKPIDVQKMFRTMAKFL